MERYSLCIELIVENTDDLFFFSNRHLYADRKAIHEKVRKALREDMQLFLIHNLLYFFEYLLKISLLFSTEESSAYADTLFVRELW